MSRKSESLAPRCIEIHVSYDRTRYTRVEAWMQLERSFPTLTDRNPWRKDHSALYWAWYAPFDSVERVEMTQRKHTDWTLVVSALGEDDFRQLLEACLSRHNPPYTRYRLEDIEVSTEIDALLQDGRKIAGIRLLRQQYPGMSLKDSKDCVEAYMGATGIPRRGFRR